jgi:hypothetical protein
MDNKVAFGVIKNVLIEQNKQLLKIVAEKHNLDYEELVEKYITPQYYLPVIQVADKKNDTDKPITKSSVSK